MNGGSDFQQESGGENGINTHYNTIWAIKVYIILIICDSKNRKRIASNIRYSNI